MKFYVGLHQPADARHVGRCMVSVNRLRDRKSDFPAREWMMDSGAFTEITTHGGYRESPAVYAAQVRRWATMPTVPGAQLVAAVSQDWMCEPFALAKTGRTVREHQALTVERYVAIRDAVAGAAYVMPVLQGYRPAEYAEHVREYGELLAPGAWVGVGSVCKRNSNAGAIERVLLTIAAERSDLRLHGFGIKLTALASPFVWDLLATADSMAWSYSARKQGRDGNDWREAAAFADRVAALSPLAPTLFQQAVAA